MYRAQSISYSYNRALIYEVYLQENVQFLSKEFIQDFVLVPAIKQIVLLIGICVLLDIHNPKTFNKLLVFLLPIMLSFVCNRGLSDFIYLAHVFATFFWIFLTIVYLITSIKTMIYCVKEAYLKARVAISVFGWITSTLTYVHSVYLPIQLAVFWLFYFLSHIYVSELPLQIETWPLVFLATMGQCCGTPLTLIALCVAISYVAAFILTGTVLFLNGWQGGFIDREMTRGWTEGITMLLIAVQTGLLDLKVMERAFLMSILLFIVASTLIQSMFEISEPILLGLSASHSGNVFKHVRAVSLFSFLWMFPLWMAYSICQYFDLDFWLLMILSSCLLTTVQSIGALLMYSLFVYDSLRSEPWDYLDDIVYGIRCFIRVLEFGVAVFIVYNGFKEAIDGDWSWMNSSILIIHCYFNVWKRLQMGWNTYLLRREAVNRIDSMQVATKEQLELFNDVCPICYQTMSSARITRCNHYFHAKCLKKWLYVNDTCPMCHSKVYAEQSAGDNETAEHAQEENIQNIDEENVNEIVQDLVAEQHTNEDNTNVSSDSLQSETKPNDISISHYLHSSKVNIVPATDVSETIQSNPISSSTDIENNSDTNDFEFVEGESES